MNIVLTSVGRRGYLVKYFKEALGENGEVHVSNSSAITPSFEYADYAVVTPLIYDNTYIKFLKNYCMKNQIDAIISLFDIDLPVLAKHKEEFNALGCKVIVSDFDFVNICNDKWKTYKFLKSSGFNCPATYLDIPSFMKSKNNGDVDYPVIIKPRWGMGSISVFQADNDEELIVLYKKVCKEIGKTYLKYEAKEDLEHCVIIQEKLCGQEYGLDIINDLSGNYQNTVVKEKFAMRSGETDCARTVTETSLNRLGEELSLKTKHIANLDCDVFLVENTPYILEMNARFGGGYPFSHIAGVNLPKAIINWLSGKSVDRSILTAKTNVLAHKDITIRELNR